MTNKIDKIKELVRWELRKNNKMYELIPSFPKEGLSLIPRKGISEANI